jgi:tryptophanyl-tRNA synthetase
VPVAQALLAEQQNLALADRERLLGYLEGSGRMILREPAALLTPASKMPGLDGQKMSKSYNNTISLRESPAAVSEKLRTMPTDPARVRRTDPGNPDICPVWQLHEVYSGADVKAWVRNGCTTAGIGCLDCKQPVIDSVLAELEPLQARAREFEQNPGRVRKILNEGSEAARVVARETLAEVRRVMGLGYT